MSAKRAKFEQPSWTSHSDVQDGGEPRAPSAPATRLPAGPPKPKRKPRGWIGFVVVIVVLCVVLGIVVGRIRAETGQTTGVPSPASTEPPSRQVPVPTPIGPTTFPTAVANPGVAVPQGTTVIVPVHRGLVAIDVLDARRIAIPRPGEAGTSDAVALQMRYTTIVGNLGSYELALDVAGWEPVYRANCPDEYNPQLGEFWDTMPARQSLTGWALFYAPAGTDAQLLVKKEDVQGPVLARISLSLTASTPTEPATTPT